MVSEVVRGIIIVLTWVGLWGMIDMLIDSISDGNRRVRFVSYFLAALLGIFLIWIVDTAV